MKLTPLLIIPLLSLVSCATAPSDQAATSLSDPAINAPYILGNGIKSRSISFENPTGEPGMGGRAESHLGVGRKGKPFRRFDPGETVTLCDIKGSGTIRHIWMTGNFGTSDATSPQQLRSLVIRAWWDGQETPSIECPLGDFMGLAHGKIDAYQSAVHSVGEKGALNIWVPMPFRSAAKITLTNEHEKPIVIFYQIDYTIDENHPEDVGRLHTLFRRENLTTLKEDFVIFPERKGRGRFIGCVIGVRMSKVEHWWGEGEVKFYMDGDTEFPTICGTGAEDYIALSYGMQRSPYAYHGCNHYHRGYYVSMYRWHLPDPIYWYDSCRVTMQQIGFDRNVPGSLYERQDDWSSATFWYESIPSDPLPPMPSLAERIADLNAGEENQNTGGDLDVGL